MSTWCTTRPADQRRLWSPEERPPSGAHPPRMSLAWRSSSSHARLVALELTACCFHAHTSSARAPRPRAHLTHAVATHTHTAATPLLTRSHHTHSSSRSSVASSSSRRRPPPQFAWLRPRAFAGAARLPAARVPCAATHADTHSRSMFCRTAAAAAHSMLRTACRDPPLSSLLSPQWQQMYTLYAHMAPHSELIAAHSGANSAISSTISSTHSAPHSAPSL